MISTEPGLTKFGMLCRVVHISCELLVGFDDVEAIHYTDDLFLGVFVPLEDIPVFPRQLGWKPWGTPEMKTILPFPQCIGINRLSFPEW